eukprot:GGOE01041320.1.p1 GENE.GGOE01041320.1~~GGOE01041320.1.p1  ORF type:complete len:865 (+),score=188.49 GGOE01041320.1:79-2673(+)
MRLPPHPWRRPWTTWVALLSAFSAVLLWWALPPSEPPWWLGQGSQAPVPFVALSLQCAPLLHHLRPQPASLSVARRSHADAPPSGALLPGSGRHGTISRRSCSDPNAGNDDASGAKGAFISRVAHAIQGFRAADAFKKLEMAALSPVWGEPDRDTTAVLEAFHKLRHALRHAVATATPSELTALVLALSVFTKQDATLRTAMNSGAFGIVRDIERQLFTAKTMQRLSPTECAILLWEFTKWKSVNHTVLRAIADGVDCARLRDLNPHIISQLAWGFAQAGAHTASLELANHLAQPGALVAFQPGFLTITCWAYARMRSRDTSLFEQFANQAIALQPHLEPWHIARLAWAFATVGLLFPSLMRTLSLAALQPGAVAGFRSWELAMTLWAFGALRFRYFPLLMACSAHLQQPQVLLRLNVVELATSTWAYARLRYFDPTFFTAIRLWAAEHGFAKASTSELVMLVWAFVVSRVDDRPTLLALAQRSLAPDVLGDLGVRQLGVLLWSFATANVTFDPLLEAYAHRASEGDFLSRGQPMETLILTWGFITLQWGSPSYSGAFKAWVDQLLASGSWEPGDLARATWSLVRLLPTDADTAPFFAIGQGLLSRPGSLQELKHQEVAALAWAHATRGVHNPDILQPLADHASTQVFLTAASPRSLATMAWAYATLCLRHQWLFQVIAHHVVAASLVEQMNALDIVMLSWSYTALQYNVHPLMWCLAQRAMEVLPTFSPGNLVTLAWAMAWQHVQYPPLLDAIANKLISEDIVQTRTPWALSRIAWTFAELDIHNRLLMAAIAEKVLKDGIEQFEASHVSKLAWAFAKLGIRYTALTDLLANRTLELQATGEFPPKHLEVVVWAIEEVWVGHD